MTDVITPRGPTARKLGRRLGLGFLLALLLAIGGAAATSSPASAATTRSNYCQSTRAPFWTSTPAAQACLAYHGRGTTWIRVTPSAVDVRNDGRSALSSGAVEQWIGGRWVDSHRWSVTDSAGYGTSEQGLTRYVYKASGAAYWRVRTVACTRNGPSGNPTGCVTGYSPYYRW